MTDENQDKDQEESEKEPFYKNKKFITILIIVAIGLAVVSSFMMQPPEETEVNGEGETEDQETDTTENETTGEETETIENKTEEKVAEEGEVAVVTIKGTDEEGNILGEYQEEFRIGSELISAELNELIEGMEINETEKIEEETQEGEIITTEITLNELKEFGEDIEKRETPTVSLHIMSKCIYGDLAVETMQPVHQLMGEKIDLEIHYIVREENGEITSLRGEEEIEQNKRELCVLNERGTEEWFDFAIKSSEKGWEQAVEEMEITREEITDCTEEKGEELIQEELEVSEEKEDIGSPTLYINGEMTREVYNYGEPNAYKEIICTGFEDQPQECEEELQSMDIQAPAGSC